MIQVDENMNFLNLNADTAIELAKLAERCLNGDLDLEHPLWKMWYEKYQGTVAFKLVVAGTLFPARALYSVRRWERENLMRLQARGQNLATALATLGLPG